MTNIRFWIFHFQYYDKARGSKGSQYGIEFRFNCFPLRNVDLDDDFYPSDDNFHFQIEMFRFRFTTNLFHLLNSKIFQIY